MCLEIIYDLVPVNIQAFCVSTLTHGGFAFKANFKHVVVFCGESKLSLCCIFLGVKCVAGRVCYLQS